MRVPLGFVSREYSLFHFYISIFNKENSDKNICQEEVPVKIDKSRCNKNLEFVSGVKAKDSNNVVVHNIKPLEIKDQNSSILKINKLVLDDKYMKNQLSDFTPGFVNFIRYISPLSCMKSINLFELNKMITEFTSTYEVNKIYGCLKSFDNNQHIKFKNN